MQKLEISRYGKGGSRHNRCDKCEKRLGKAFSIVAIFVSKWRGTVLTWVGQREGMIVCPACDEALEGNRRIVLGGERLLEHEAMRQKKE